MELFHRTPSPLGRDYAHATMSLTRFEPGRPCNLQRELHGLSASPPIDRLLHNAASEQSGTSDRMSGLLCWRNVCSTRAVRSRIAGLLRQASVDLGEHLSMHPALRADHVQTGKVCLLAGMVSSGLPSVTDAKATSCGCRFVAGLTASFRTARLTK